MKRMQFSLGNSKQTEGTDETELTTKSRTGRITKRRHFQKYNLHMKSLVDIPEDEEIYIYAC